MEQALAADPSDMVLTERLRVARRRTGCARCGLRLLDCIPCERVGLLCLLCKLNIVVDASRQTVWFDGIRDSTA